MSKTIRNWKYIIKTALCSSTSQSLNNLKGSRYYGVGCSVQFGGIGKHDSIFSLSLSLSTKSIGYSIQLETNYSKKWCLENQKKCLSIKHARAPPNITQRKKQKLNYISFKWMIPAWFYNKYFPIYFSFSVLCETYTRIRSHSAAHDHVVHSNWLLNLLFEL